MRHAVIVLGSFLEVSPLLLSDEHDFLVVDLGESGENGSVVAIGVVAVQFDELVEDQFEVIKRLRTMAVASQLNDISGIEMIENLTSEPGNLQPHIADRLFDVWRRIGLRFKLGELLFEFDDRLFKRQRDTVRGVRSIAFRRQVFVSRRMLVIVAGVIRVVRRHGGL